MDSAERFFAGRGWHPFAFQRDVWRAYREGRSGLLHSATGSGKTLAVWLGEVAAWHEEHGTEVLPAGRGRATVPPLRVLWITPLRALAADTMAALQEPLTALEIPWTLETRTGDTPASRRARQRERLPTALVTTPESLTLLLTRDTPHELFAELQLVVIDEWHELLGSKRGVQVELALARLRQWCPALRTWGLSATLGDLDVALRALVGNDDDSAVLVRGSSDKAIEIDAVIPASMERFPWAGHLGTRLVREVVEIIERHRVTLLFTNTRSQTELWYRALLLASPALEGDLALHHGSLDRDIRRAVEERLKSGTVRCVVCTSSLDLGVDFSPVDRVLQVGSPKGVARLLQRAGRSGHQPGAISRVTCVPTHAFELIEVAAAREAASRGELESRRPPRAPLDVLAQHLVTCALGGGFVAVELLQEIRSTFAYRDISDVEWQWTMNFVSTGGAALGGYAEFHRIAIDAEGIWRVPDRKIAMRHRMSVGTIVSDATVTVRFLRGAAIGTVEESFVARLRPGDRFLFAGRPLEFVRTRDLTAWVRLAAAASGVSRWMGARMPLSSELAHAVRRQLTAAREHRATGAEMEAMAPLLAVQERWSEIPDSDTLLIERLTSREGHHLFLYPFAGRLVHEGLAALLAYRLAQQSPQSFSLAISDYGLELLSPTPIALDAESARTLLSLDDLASDIIGSMNAAEMARRQFREIARITGLVFQGPPGATKSVRQVQASSGLLFDVFARHDPDNLLLGQAYREVLERQLEETRLVATLRAIEQGQIRVVTLEAPSPFAFPLIVEHFRARLSSEKLVDRVRRMTLTLERKAR